jgi:hypothetical protein
MGGLWSGMSWNPTLRGYGAAKNGDAPRPAFLPCMSMDSWNNHLKYRFYEMPGMR